MARLRGWAMGFLSCGLLLLGAGEARAANGDESFSLTMSPLHLFAPILEIQGELRATDGLGVALIGGYGSLTVDGGPGLGDVPFRVVEVGSQIVWYPLDAFKSLQLGVEAMWIHVSTDDVGTFDATGFASGLAIGPLIGLKMIARPGFTAFIQLGYQFVAVHAEASDTTGDSASGDEQTGILLLNLNLGWSF